MFPGSSHTSDIGSDGHKYSEIESTDQTCCYLVQSQNIDTRPNSPNTDPETPSVEQSSPRSTNFKSLVYLGNETDCLQKKQPPSHLSYREARLLSII